MYGDPLSLQQLLWEKQAWGCLASLCLWPAAGGLGPRRTQGAGQANRLLKPSVSHDRSEKEEFVSVGL